MLVATRKYWKQGMCTKNSTKNSYSNSWFYFPFSFVQLQAPGTCLPAQATPWCRPLLTSSPRPSACPPRTAIASPSGTLDHPRTRTPTRGGHRPTVSTVGGLLLSFYLYFLK